MTKLRELDACFVAGYKESATGSSSFHEQQELDGAQGLMFTCPACRTETVICWFRNPINAPKVPDSAYPRPGRWTFSGTCIDDATLSPSVNLDTDDAESKKKYPDRCRWHGWVKNGDAA